jgi:hypothetical protein
MKSRLLRWMTAVVLMHVFTAPANAWLIYSKPEFRCRVIDSETKSPIGGAVVVVLYQKWEFGGPGGGITRPMDAKETLTDKNGDFHFPSYLTLIGPLSRVSEVSFIIFKPDYMSVTRIDGISIPEETYLTIARDKVGTEGMITYVDRWDRKLSFKGSLGIVELNKARTREEKLRTMPSPPANYTSRDLPILIKIVNDEIENLGLKGEYK